MNEAGADTQQEIRQSPWVEPLSCARATCVVRMMRWAARSIVYRWRETRACRCRVLLLWLHRAPLLVCYSKDRAFKYWGRISLMYFVSVLSWF